MENKIVKQLIGMEICGFCGEKVDDDWNYCPNCKCKFEKIRCNSCGIIVSSDWKYCPYCKTQLGIDDKDKKDVLKNTNDWLRNVLGE